MSLSRISCTMDVLQILVALLLKMWHWILSAVVVPGRYFPVFPQPLGETENGLLQHLSWKKIFTYEWWIQQTFTRKNLLNSSVFLFFSIGDMFCIERLNVELFCRLLFIFWLWTSIFFSSKIVLFSTIIKDPTYTDRLLSVMAVFCEHKCGTHLHLFDTFVQEHHEPCRWHYLLHSSSPWHFLDLCCISLMGVFVERLCSASIFTNAPSAFIHLENWFIW